MTTSNGMVHFSLIYRQMHEFDQWKKYVPEGRCVAFAVRSGDEYIVLIDSEAPAEAQKNCLRHELAHIICGHLNNWTKKDYLENHAAIEAEANQYADQMTDEEFDYLMTFADSIRAI